MTVRTLRPYVLAHNKQLEEQNYMMWLQGVYFKDALEVAIGNAFCRKEGTRPYKYMDKPIDIITEEKQTSEAEMEKADEDALKAIAAQWGCPFDAIDE